MCGKSGPKALNNSSILFFKPLIFWWKTLKILVDVCCVERRLLLRELYDMCSSLKLCLTVYNETVRQLFVDFKKAYDSVKREVFYNILTEFGVLMKLIKMCLNETYSKVRIDK
jgi:hypothetical protein